MTHSPFWIGTSWKMNKTLAEARAFAQGLLTSTGDPRMQRFVIPPFTAIREVKAILVDTSVKVGAQNMHWADRGAWTGEISPPMLVDCAMDLVELGHSERREHFGETDDTVGLKVEAAVRHGLTPLICIGEMPGIVPFHGLGQLSPPQMASLLDRRQRVNEGQKLLGRDAWRAFCAPDPTGLEALLRRDLSPLPFLAGALRRHLEEFPSTFNGLSRNERQILRVLVEGASTFEEVFRGTQKLEFPSRLPIW